MDLIRLMRADLLKVKNTSYYYIHALVPVVVATMLVIYYGTKPNDGVGSAIGFLETISMGFPLIIGVVCSLVIEKEVAAGRFKEMLSSKYGKFKCLLSKLLVLVSCGFISFYLSVFVFYTGLKYVYKKVIINLGLFMKVSLIVFAVMIFFYIFHLWLSIKFGVGASVGMGVFESLFATLLDTGLGEGIWQYIPCGFASRLVKNYFIINYPSKYTVKLNLRSIISVNNTAVINCVIFTIIVGIFLAIWFNYFEGRGEV